MSSPKKELRKDILISVVISIIVFGILYWAGHPRIVVKNIGPFNSTITTVLGLLFTVLAIVYTFESQFEKNRAVKKLKTQGHYKDITQVFFLSVAIIGVVWIYTFTVTVFAVESFFNSTLGLILGYLAVLSFIVVIFRVVRCFWVFVLLNKAVKSSE
ncbi:hypothetical protein [Halobaculum sp. EA56]|uniref:hypothetical protein n=1 Tax=Halobaculum sp. EA56 TaxID=3421648 RepID=UPI003EBE3BE2